MSKKQSNAGLIKAAEAMYTTLLRTERFLTGFEDDKENGAYECKLVRDTIALAKGKIPTAKEEQIVIYVEGGIVQAVYTNLAQVKVVILDKDQEDIGEPIRQMPPEPEPLELAPPEIARHL